MDNDYKETIRQIIRRQNVQSPAAQQILGYIETLMGEVSINRDMLIEKLEEILAGENSNDKNVLRKVIDSVLGIFGLNVVSENDRQKIGKVSLKQEQQLLSINTVQAANVISAIVGEVDSSEAKSSNCELKAVQLEEQLAKLNSEMEKNRQERDALRKECDQKDRETLQSMQRILAQHPEWEPAQENEKDALMLYLNDLGLTWSWDDVSALDDFITYKISDPDFFAGVKQPCLYRDGEVVLKGLRFTIEG